MNRRAVLAAAGMLVLPRERAHAQPASVRRLAILSPSQFPVDSIRRIVLPELARLGFVEGANLAITAHVGAMGDLPSLARDTLATRPEVVLASTNPAVNALLALSKTVPIVMCFAGEDPIAAGIAQTLGRPGGSVTGLTNLATLLDGKRVSLLHEALPSVKRVGLLAIPPPRHLASVARMEGVAAELTLETRIAFAYEEATYPAAFRNLKASGAEAVATASSPEYLRDAASIGRIALSEGLPIIGKFSFLAHEGFLIGHGPDLDAFRLRAASFVARILQGAAPGDLPIEQPTKFELAINLRTARLLGRSVAPALLAQADEVIE